MPAVVVVGSGAAGLAAAVAAADAGADVVVVEARSAVGGTTSLSGGVVWAPGNHLQRAGGPDAAADVEDACRYVCSIAHGDVVPALMRSFTGQVGTVVRQLEERTPLEWELLEHWPDYRAEAPGAAMGGRSLWPKPLTLPAALTARLESDPIAPAAPASPREPADRPDQGRAAAASDAEVLRGPVRGRTLVGGLLAALAARRVEVRTASPVGGLVQRGGEVIGVEVAGERMEGRVVLASGGFQFDAALRATFLGGPPVVAMGVPTSRGDGLRMAQSVGAALGNMAEGWWMPAAHVPGEHLDGVPFYRPLHAERAQPGAVMVDRSGMRFVDESQNYGDVGRSMARFDAASAGYRAAPCWLLMGEDYRRRYVVGPLRPDDDDPPWLVRADDVLALADALGMSHAVLKDTMARFDAAAAIGDDPDFGRGRHRYGRWIGDGRAVHPTLAPVGGGPLYALEVHLGCMGTKGGPRTDGCGRVLGLDGSAVPGLYAAGNVAASPFGTATAAGGATLGPALTFGFLSGEAAAGDR